MMNDQVRDQGKGVGKFVIHRFANRNDYEAWKPYDRSEFPNVLLNEGITRLLNLLIGGGGTNYARATAFLGVGDSTASSGVATSTGLLSTVAGNRLYVQCSTGYPTISAQTVTWRAVFSSAQANHNWREFTVSNSTSATFATAQAAENLNRAVSNQGTKASGQTWTLDLSITVS